MLESRIPEPGPLSRDDGIAHLPTYPPTHLSTEQLTDARRPTSRLTEGASKRRSDRPGGQANDPLDPHGRHCSRISRGGLVPLTDSSVPKSSCKMYYQISIPAPRVHVARNPSVSEFTTRSFLRRWSCRCENAPVIADMNQIRSILGREAFNDGSSRGLFAALFLVVPLSRDRRPRARRHMRRGEARRDEASDATARRKLACALEEKRNSKSGFTGILLFSLSLVGFIFMRNRMTSKTTSAHLTMPQNRILVALSWGGTRMTANEIRTAEIRLDPLI